MAGITEEVSTASKDISEKQDEATTVYEREEQKYIAEEKEVVNFIFVISCSEMLKLEMYHFSNHHLFEISLLGIFGTNCQKIY